MAENRKVNGRFRKGFSGNPDGKQRLNRMVVFDLRQAARRHCPEALEVIAEGMRHKDARVRLIAAAIMLERGYGKPEQKSDAAVVHRFVQAPEVMDQAKWLARRGQPALADARVGSALLTVRIQAGLAN
jgi:hypothetical protein